MSRSVPVASQLPLFRQPETRESLPNDTWRACDIVRRDNNCGWVMQYVKYLANLELFRPSI